jgi:hypothetical protein
MTPGPTSTGEHVRTILIPAESNDYVRVVVEAVPPRGWRDAWRVLRGTYQPLVRRRRTATFAGVQKALKEVWCNDELIEQLRSPVLHAFLTDSPEPQNSEKPER